MDSLSYQRSEVCNSFRGIISVLVAFLNSLFLANSISFWGRPAAYRFICAVNHPFLHDGFNCTPRDIQGLGEFLVFILWHIFSWSSFKCCFVFNGVVIASSSYSLLTRPFRYRCHYTAIIWDTLSALSVISTSLEPAFKQVSHFIGINNTVDRKESHFVNCCQNKLN